MVEKFNRDLLLTARCLRRINQKELADKAGISQTYLSRIENGTREVTTQALKALSGALEFPVEFFCQNQAVWGLPLSLHPAMHRKKKRVSKKSIDRLHSEINLRLFHLRKFLEAVDIEPKLTLPSFDPDDFNFDFEKIAEAVRRTWLIPAGPIDNLTNCLELAGIVVIHVDFQDSDIDGLSMEVPGLPPCIFLNINQPADRMRFSAAHELGHLVMHNQLNAEMEGQANAFASALLMPEQDIKRHLVGKVDLNLLAQLKPIWRTAMAAILYRASEIKAITPWQSRNLWQQMSARGYRKKEPVDIEREQPELFPEIIRLHLEDLNYSPEELAKILLTYGKDLFFLYGIGTSSRPSPHLVAVPK